MGGAGDFFQLKPDWCDQSLHFAQDFINAYTASPVSWETSQSWTNWDGSSCIQLPPSLSPFGSRRMIPILSSISPLGCYLLHELWLCFPATMHLDLSLPLRYNSLCPWPCQLASDGDELGARVVLYSLQWPSPGTEPAQGVHHHTGQCYIYDREHDCEPRRKVDCVFSHPKALSRQETFLTILCRVQLRVFSFTL